MKALILIPLALLFAVAAAAQPDSDSNDATGIARAQQEVHAVNQSLALAYIRGVDRLETDLFYGENFRLASSKDSRESRQQMEDEMKRLVREGLLSHQRLMEGDLLLTVPDSQTVVVNGIWRESITSGTAVRQANTLAYVFTYARQEGVWKLTTARFLSPGQSLSTGKN